MVIAEQYIGLGAGYAAAIAAIYLLQVLLKPNFLSNPSPQFAKPWFEFALALGAAVLIVGIGQLYNAKLLLQSGSQVNEALNQLIIFSPMLILLLVRGQPLRSAYLSPRAAIPGLALGVALAFVALFAYVAARGIPQSYPSLLATVFDPKLAHNAVQVFLEDVAVAALLSRLALAAGNIGVVAVVAALFAAAHAPTMIANGAGPDELTTLVYDTALGVFALGAVLVTRSIWWFFPLHFVMDMSQFFRA